MNSANDQEINLAPHLIGLPGTDQWALWRQIVLRSAGFPIAEIFKMTLPEMGTAVTQLLQAQEARTQAHEQALTAVNDALDALRQAGEWDSQDKRMPLVNILRTLKKNKLPQSPPDELVAVTVVQLRKALEEESAALENFEKVYHQVKKQELVALHDIFQSPRFREAIIWQNRKIFHDVIKKMSDKPIKRNSRQRQREELLASYLQRYCTKNDTIGFFGPVGWAIWSNDESAIQIKPGDDIIAIRNVYFEAWAIDELVKILNQNEAYRPWMKPRRPPLLLIEGQTLYWPRKKPMWIPTSWVKVLNACNGDKTAKQIAVDLVNSSLGSTFDIDANVYHLLAEFKQRGMIIWEFEVPLGPYPERTLRQLLEEIEDVQLRNSALVSLTELEAARTAVVGAAGDVLKLDKALDELDETFSRLTGTAPSRRHGQTYAARTLIYEDCQRDIDMSVGSQVLNELSSPLSLILLSARWFTYEAATIMRETCSQLYTEIADKMGTTSIRAGILWARLAKILSADEGQDPFSRVTHIFRDRWSEILALSKEERTVQLSSENLRPRIEAAFNVPGPGWQMGRYHNPDVMIAAESVEAIQRGYYEFVLGEIHPAINTLTSSFWLEQHPAPEKLFEAIDIDLPEPNLYYAIPKDWPGATARTHRRLMSPKDYFLLFSDTTVAAPTSHVLPISEMVIEDRAGTLVLRTADSHVCFNLVEAVGDALLLSVSRMADHFQLVEPDGHTPRVTIDRLIVSRETWDIDSADIAFASEGNTMKRFLSAQRWARSYQMPRFVFVRVPTERKPFYVDFTSPIYVNLFAKAVRQTMAAAKKDKPSMVTITEMVPSPEQVWLNDAQGQRFTSELRLIALDLLTAPTQEQEITQFFSKNQ